jgi:hypothetical protein
VRIALLSTDGRDDIVDGFVKFAERFWPDRPWPIEVIIGDPEGSYCQRIIGYLKSIPDEVLMMAMDDFWPYPAVDQKAIDDAYDYIQNRKSVGAIHLLPCKSTMPSCAELPGFKFIGAHDADRSSEGAFLTRREYMLEITEKIGARLNTAQDAGIVGMTNWELQASRVGSNWDVLCPEPTNAVFQRINAAAEAQWRESTIELVKQLRMDLDMTQRPLWDGRAPHCDMWNATRP